MDYTVLVSAPLVVVMSIDHRLASQNDVAIRQGRATRLREGKRKAPRTDTRPKAPVFLRPFCALRKEHIHIGPICWGKRNTHLRQQPTGIAVELSECLPVRLFLTTEYHHVADQQTACPTRLTCRPGGDTCHSLNVAVVCHGHRTVRPSLSAHVLCAGTPHGVSGRQRDHRNAQGHFPFDQYPCRHRHLAITPA